MRFPLLPALVILVLNCCVDICLYRFLKRECRYQWPCRVQKWSSLILALAFVLLICMPKRRGGDEGLLTVMWALYAYLTVYVPKYIFVIFDLISSIPRIWRGKRVAAVAWTGGALGVAVFGLMWWGALINRFDLQVTHVQVEIPGLPQKFDGYRIVQISDMHTGTFGGDTVFVSEIVDSINALHPDLVVFTGDIVNRKSQELEPYTTVLSRIEAPVYSIMGNHDYGDYCEWPDAAAQEADIKALKEMQRTMGWTMLNNEHTWIKSGNDSIVLIGVENIGDPPFRRYGDLEIAYPELTDGHTKILLSHSPAHYVDDIKNKDKNIALTLSGHTHAMQIELFGYSPGSWRYPIWGGLYDDGSGHQIYVNIGCGTVGMPFRIGADPEITVLTLKPSDAKAAAEAD